MQEHSDIIKNSPGYYKTLLFYSDFITHYSWRYNCAVPKEFAEKEKIFLESKGLEVFVGTIAFDMIGRIVESSRAIFVRVKKK